MIATSREKTPDQIRSLIDQGPYLANAAKEKGSSTMSRPGPPSWNGWKRKSVNPSISTIAMVQAGQDPQPGQSLCLFTVLAEMLQPPQPSEDKDVVAIVYVEGAILPGHGQASPFGSEGPPTVVTSARPSKPWPGTRTSRPWFYASTRREDRPEASEVILNATRQVQAEKPLIVSMGNMAASGGYYVSCAADEIYADECTLTASIGVVGGKLIPRACGTKSASVGRVINAEPMPTSSVPTGLQRHQRRSSSTI